MVEPTQSPALPGVLQGRYRIGARLGRGGASTVYRARDLLLGREVAIKVFATRAISQEELRVQEGEARLLGGLNHPGLVSLLDAGVDLTDPDAPQVFLIMEFVDGPDLRERLRHGPLSEFEIAYLGWDLLGALQYVHDHGIIHRDVKPANVLLSPAQNRPDRGQLGDFGIAMLTDEIEKPSEETVGTAAYLSPEQVEGGVLDAKTDIYSLGLVLLEAATARPAYPGDVLETAFARLDRDPDMPCDLADDVADILRSMTARSPAERPTAGEAAAAFRAVIVRHLGGPAPQTPDPELARLTAVRDSQLLDTPPDEEFDRLTAMAARVFDVPVAVIALVDEHRVWLKSRHGLDVEELERQTGLGSTGSLHQETLIIADTTTDPRVTAVAGNPESPYRSYAGVPLITREGHNLGAFALADTRPHPMTPDEVRTLEDLAAMALHEIELRQAVRRIALSRVP